MSETKLLENSIKLPVGTSAQRPSSPVEGDIRYNTDLDAIEFYNATEWVGIGVLDGSSSGSAAPSAAYIKTLTGTNTSGTYWIKNDQMASAIEVYCDMTYDGGGWMLLAYGYVASTASSSSNYALPNLNHDGTVYNYTPDSRASTHGLVQSPNGQKSALLIAKNSTDVLLAAGNNPSSGGIDSYGYVYKFPIPDPSALTFNNHQVAYSSNNTSVTVTVQALKGDSGNYTRYTQKEALGVTWNDSAPTGYGVSNVSPATGVVFNAGPFFPSVQKRNDGWVASPDIGVNGFNEGSRTYTYRGWYRANGNGYTGQTSMWFK